MVSRHGGEKRSLLFCSLGLLIADTMPFRADRLWLMPFAAVSVLVYSRIFTAYVATNQTESKSMNDCLQKCVLHNGNQEEMRNLANVSTMLQRAERERDKLVARLKVDYGDEYYSRLFLDSDGDSIGRTGFRGANETDNASRERYLRKTMMKILTVQLAFQEELQSLDDCHCDATIVDRPGNKSDTNNTSHQDAFPKQYAKFVWANGGHSTAAGHGNLFSESYTAVMERSAMDAFAAVGITLEGRNYGMGGIQSGPELALCNEAIYGLDADLITWNFGLTDGTAWWRTALYGHRRGVHRNQPLLLDLDIGTSYGMVEIGSSDPDSGIGMRLKMMRDLERAGLATMYMAVNHLYDYDSKEAFPDMQNMTQAEMDAVPELLRYFRCGERLENGDPYCEEKKYSNKCTRMRAGWHPGWKAHALQGNMMAVFMVDLLIDALGALSETEQYSTMDKRKLLQQLKSEEDADYERFFHSAVPDLEFVKDFWKDIPHDHSLLFRRPALCRTALLPAETRFKGHLEQYDKGYNTSALHKYDASTLNLINSMALVSTKSKYQRCPPEESPLDFKDYFYVTRLSGNASLVVPNEAEKRAYVREGQENFYGLVIVCFFNCRQWDRCPNGNIGPSNIFQKTRDNKNAATMWVNGNLVTEPTPLSQDCALLRGSHGHVWKPNKENQYELTVQINDPNGSMRITSVILI